MRKFVALALAAIVSACNQSSPTAPTPPPPVIVVPPPAPPSPVLVSLTLSPSSGTLTVGQSAPIGLTGFYNDGVSRAVTGNWTSSNTAVATVGSTGFVTALAPGQTTITASAGGQSIGGLYTVNASISGTWSGAFIVEACTGQGSNNDVFCSQGRGLTTVNSSQPGSLELSLNGSSVSGVMGFGGVRGPVSGVIVNGQMTLQGTLTLSNGPSLTITYWSSIVRVNEMQGFVSFEARYPQFAGVAVIQTRMSNLLHR